MRRNKKVWFHCSRMLFIVAFIISSVQAKATNIFNEHRLWGIAQAPKNIINPKDTSFSKAQYKQMLQHVKRNITNKSFLYTVALNAKHFIDKENLCKITKIYVSQIKYPLTPNDLTFLQDFTLNNEDACFKFIIKNADSIEKLGKVGEGAIVVAQNIIANESRSKVFSNDLKPDLNLLEKVFTSKYGILGEQVILQDIALNYYFKKDLDNWFATKLKIHSKYPDLTSVFDLNNDAWFLFKNVTDKEKLETALIWSKEVIGKEATANYYDTYANILYKLGRKTDAIEAQERGLQLPRGNAANSETIKENLLKMKKNIPTWE